MSKSRRHSAKVRQLREAVRRLIVTHRVLEEAKRPCGTPITIPHAYALLELLHSGAPMTVSELAARLTIDRTNVSRLCIRMERDGELERCADPNDRRARALSLTAHGKRLAHNVEKNSLEHFARVTEELSGSPEAVIEALETLAEAMVEASSEKDEG